MQIEIAKAVEKREFKMQRLIDLLHGRVLHLEEEIIALKKQK